MPSQYLNCDHCQETIGAEDVADQRTSTLGGTPALITYAKRLGWSIEPGLDLCPKCVRFTYDEHDEQRILNAIQDPVKRRLVELIFQYASDGPGLAVAEFNEIQELTK